MNFSMYFYCLLALYTSQVLGFNPRYKLPLTAEYNPDNTRLKISQDDWKNPSLDYRRGKTVKEETDEKIMATLKTRKSPHLKPDSSWWPSKVDYSNAFNEIRKSSSESTQRVTQRPATFEELENRNANIYNPLLNLDHRPDPSKKYTFVELENMNANQYNPYLN